MNTVITYSRYGGPEVLVPSEAAIPQPGPGQVRIRVKAVAVNLIDAKIRGGRLDGVIPVTFPVLPGWDVAGVVDAADDGASASAGDEVFGVAAVGGYSQYALLDRPVAKPAGLSFEIAAAVVTVGETAFRGLKHLGLKAGQTLLILGAGGSVGTIAAQLAVARGITVIGTAGEGDLARLTALGVTAVRYGDGWAERVRDAAAAGVDAVFDTSGAGLLGDAIALAGDASRVITIADPSAAEHGVRFTGQDPADRAPEALPELAALLANGEMTLPVWRSYPLAEAATAHADLEAGRNRGKIILLP
ncbi:MAG TPA: NADP-dependent oxidoreductase [Trebonia sp.]|nr:NADP-dependent oxidoreductase [Trebonia sp.]